MKLTEAILKQLINEVLEEGMKTASELPEDVYVKVFHNGRKVTVAFSDKDGNRFRQFDTKTFEENPIWGSVSFLEKDKNKPCDQSAVIAITDVADGWGPLLYDIAMEVATMRSNGLAPDRFIVSGPAYKVWDYYLNKRTNTKDNQIDDENNQFDVKSHQLDDEKNTLTSNEMDNCGQEAARGDFGEKWYESPLSKRYTKEPTTIKALGKKLIWEL